MARRPNTNISRCPWHGHRTHTGARPEAVHDSVLLHIHQQIAVYHLRALPFFGIAEKLYRCRDCSAVWVANSVFQRVAEEQVCGVYDQTLVWKPFPEVERK
jgi:hypothetical protein